MRDHLARLIAATAAAMLLLSVGSVPAATPLGTGFNYQGRLSAEGLPLNDTCDFEFTLWDSNENGAQVGVDNQTLKEEGLPVRELFSGCVCCSLRLDLVTTLLELERELRPDVVLLEPSGVAGPDAVARAFVGYGGNIDRRVLLTVVDASRFETLFRLNLPIFAAGLDVADLVLVNKMDRVDNAALARITAAIRSVKPAVPVQPVSALHGTHLDTVVAPLLAEYGSVPEPARAPGSGEALPTATTTAKAATPRRPAAANGPEPAVFAAECALRFAPAAASEQVCAAVQARLRRLETAILQEGATFIGHIKAIVRSPQAGYLLFSLTAFNGELQVRGALRQELTEARLTLNAIVYGISTAALERAAQPVLAEDF